MLSKGQKINGRYSIVNSIGEGGMANVYLATDDILDRKVAIKVLRGDLSADEKFIRRFEREAQAVSNLSHPNIVEVYDVGIEEGNHYTLTENTEKNAGNYTAIATLESENYRWSDGTTGTQNKYRI